MTGKLSGDGGGCSGGSSSSKSSNSSSNSSSRVNSSSQIRGYQPFHLRGDDVVSCGGNDELITHSSSCSISDNININHKIKQLTLSAVL